MKPEKRKVTRGLYLSGIRTGITQPGKPPRSAGMLNQGKEI
jgi:hypothetical protein